MKDAYFQTPDERKATKRERRQAAQARRRERLGAPRAHMAVLALMLRRFMPPAMLTMLGMILAEVGLFARKLVPIMEQEGPYPAPRVFGLLLDGSGALWMFGVAFAVLTVLVLLRAPTVGRGKPVYTVRRLSVGPTAVCLWQVAAVLATYLLLVFGQILTVWGLGLWYGSVIEATILPLRAAAPTVMLTFYENSLLHTLLPLADLSLWPAAGATMVAVAVATVRISAARWREERVFFSRLALPFFAICYPTGMGNAGSNLLILTPLALAYSVTVLILWLKGGRRYEAHEED